MKTTIKPIELNLINTVLTSAHGYDLIGGEATHEPSLKFVAQVALYTQDGDEVCEIIRSLLPETYDGDTLKEVPEMLSAALKKGFHEDKTKKEESTNEKQSVVAIRLISEKIHSLFHSATGESYAEIDGPDGGMICHAVGSTEIKQLIGHCFYKANGMPLPKMALQETIDTLKAKARYEGQEEEVHVRCATYENATYIDLGRRDCKCVKIDASGHSIVTQAPVHFVRPKGFGELPLPEAEGSLSDLQEALGLDDQTFILVMAFLISFFSPTGPRFGMMVQGEQGSGKSILSSFLKRLLDPSIIDRTRMPKSEQELAIMAEQHALLIFDNASTLNWELSDFLCTLLTGGSLLVRKLYTENESFLFTFRRVILMNGIGDYANRPDLLERCIQVNLKAMPQHLRKTERELNDVLDKLMPRFLHQLYDCVSYAYKNVHDIETPRDIRMSDAAQWIVASEPATDFTPGSMLDALVGVQKEMMAERVINNPLVMALIALLEKSESTFEGTVGTLFSNLTTADQYNKSLPKTAAHLSTAIKRLAPAMAKIGLKVEFGERSRKGKHIKVWLENDLAQNEVDHDF